MGSREDLVLPNLTDFIENVVFSVSCTLGRRHVRDLRGRWVANDLPKFSSTRKRDLLLYLIPEFLGTMLAEPDNKRTGKADDMGA